MFTRPDVAFTVSRLAWFNLNPGLKYLTAVNRVIQYLLLTSNYALKLGGGDTFKTWTNASFADNIINYRSLQAYVTKLFSGVISWRANKQDIIITSTTKAELLVLTQGTKEALFSLRLI